MTSGHKWVMLGGAGRKSCPISKSQKIILLAMMRCMAVAANGALKSSACHGTFWITSSKPVCKQEYQRQKISIAEIMKGWGISMLISVKAGAGAAPEPFLRP